MIFFILPKYQSKRSTCADHNIRIFPKTLFACDEGKGLN